MHVQIFLWSGRSKVQISDRSNRTQCCQRLATVATLLRIELCCPGAMTRRWAPPTRYTLRRITASIMKDLIWFWVSVASEEAGFGPGWGSLILLMTNLSITAKQDKTQCTTVTKLIFGQGQSDHVHSLLMLACYHGATASAPIVNFLIVK